MNYIGIADKSYDVYFSTPETSQVIGSNSNANNNSHISMNITRFYTYSCTEKEKDVRNFKWYPNKWYS